jgi:hypothetical protein
MRSKLWIGLWFVVEVALMVWYVAGGSRNLFPVAYGALLIGLAPLMKKASWLARAWYAALWIFALWWLWRAFH